MNLVTHSPHDEQKRVIECFWRYTVREPGVLSLDSIKDLTRKISTEERLVILTPITSPEDLRKLESSLEESIGLFSETLHRHCFLFVSELETQNLGFLFASPLFNGILLLPKDQESQRNTPGNAEAAAMLHAVLLAAEKPISSGLERFHSTNTSIETIEIIRSTHKFDSVEAVRSFAQQIGFKTRNATAIASTVDELIMNAVFDAPVDEFGNQLHSALDRATDFSLNGRQVVKMNISVEQKTLMISVQDQFGSLQRQTLLDHILRSYSSAEYRVRNTTASAGLGIAQSFEKGASFVFTFKSNEFTDVTVLFPNIASFKDYKNQPRAFVILN